LYYADDGDFFLSMVCASVTLIAYLRRRCIKMGMRIKGKVFPECQGLWVVLCRGYSSVSSDPSYPNK